jgi:hypothetical protein
MSNSFNSKKIFFTPEDVTYLLENYIQVDTSTTYGDVLRTMLNRYLVWV